MVLHEVIDLLIEDLLVEAKIDQLIQQHAGDPPMSAFLEVLKAKNIHPKYLPWLVKQAGAVSKKLKDNSAEWREYATSAADDIVAFDKLVQLKYITGEASDINRYQSWNSLVSAIEEAKARHKQKQTEKAGKKNTIKVFEDGEYLVIEPQSEEAAVAYGKDTRWCISATTSKNHFQEYADAGARFLFILNKQTGDKDAIAFAGNVSEFEIFDAEDNEKEPTYISYKYPKPLLQIVNKYLEEIVGEDSFALVYTADELLSDMSPLYGGNISRMWPIFTQGELKDGVRLLLGIVRDPVMMSEKESRHTRATIQNGLGLIVRKLTESATFKFDNDAVMMLWTVLQELDKNTLGRAYYTPSIKQTISLYVLAAIHPEHQRLQWILEPMIKAPRFAKEAFEQYKQDAYRFKSDQSLELFIPEIYKIAAALGTPPVQKFWRTYKDIVDDGGASVSKDYTRLFLKIVQAYQEFGEGSGWDIERAAQMAMGTQ